jgi:lactoylglutathione lyase
MRYRTAFPIIYTADLPRALVFYRDAIGFAETFRFPADGEAEFVAMKLDDSTGIALSGPGESFHGRPVDPAPVGSSCAST